ncbi:MAG: glycosyltransferase family 4 protein [Actinomycetota bacterium]
MSPAAKALARRALMLAGRVLPGAACPVGYVVEAANWSIRWDGTYYAQAVNARHPGTVEVTDRPWRHPGRVLHFGSQFVWELWAAALPAASRPVVTYFHGRPEDGPDMARHVDAFLKSVPRLAKVVTAAAEVEARLLSWGVPRAKLARVPLGVDTALLRPPTADQRAAARAALGIPDGALAIGSFQKDGVGWGEGMEPKLIKGPDLFVEAMRRLARDFPVVAVLTGPARGYVKAGLEAAGVPFVHRWVEDFRDLGGCWHALDLYLMTSREEGGPKAVLESMATGVPLVCHRTGMAADVIEDGTNAALVEVGAMDALVARAAALLADQAARAAMAQAGRRTAEGWDWQAMGDILWRDVYAELLA